MRQDFTELLEGSPIIAAVKDFHGLEVCMTSECRVVFVLFGDICNIAQIVHTIKAGGKTAIVHIDLIDGLSSKDVAVRFLRENTEADGIISTRTNLIKLAHEQGFLTIQRFFLIDSIALANVRKTMDGGVADFVEILPGVMPKIVRRIASYSAAPLIAGGLISDKEDVISILQAGATAISTTCADCWFM
ncbi:glycerol-3-phosphate responsive antiterminator [Zongyangia hominis]|uniref:glycerol-3-phosphate responsive antiterminator n=1 Tax=Zongyangia hominis TaxID=2763677 RepID=UPI0037094248